MQTRLSRSDASRMRSDLEAAIEYLPGLASLALWCNFADTEEDVVAYTDGSTIYAGKKYADFAPKQRRFICLHEILHIALCHPSRFQELEKREMSVFLPELLNIAADAIINTGLEKLSGLEIPPEAWSLAKIWQCLEKAEDAANSSVTKNSSSYPWSAAAQNRKIAHLTRAEFIAAGRWSGEELYYFLKTQVQSKARFHGFLAEVDGRDVLSGDLRRNLRGTSKRSEKYQLNNQTSAEMNAEKQTWQERLGLLRGTVPELFQRLSGELPRVETPWEQIFRNLIQNAFQEATHKNYSRPNRRWLALERDYQSQAGVTLPFSPDSVKKRGARLAVALDTSGSIDKELLGRFLSEIAALCAFNQRNLVLIIGDAAVHQVAEIDWRDAFDELARIKLTGGGGTDFRPLIKAAEDFTPDALVYLTDLYGETGDEPDFPVIWATHGVCGNAPWGEQIKLK